MFEEQVSKQYSLSRTFCNLICRRDVVMHEPELIQIGKIMGISILPILEMEYYPDEDSINLQLEIADNDIEKRAILADAEIERNKLKGNINQVIETINNLLYKLNAIENLPELLLPKDNNTLNNQKYFADFKLDKGGGYIGNNFGQDLRNFKRFLDLIDAQGINTVWFSFG